MGLSGYIIESTHRDSAQFSADTDHWGDSIEQFCKGHDFIGLTIEETDTVDDTGCVQFIAHLQKGTHDLSFRERSSFRKCESGRWKYFGAII